MRIAARPIVPDSPDAACVHGNLGGFERECVELFAEVVQVLGVPRSLGQIYGLLFASPHPLPFAEIVEQLAISKGSGSQGLRLLRELGAVRGVRSEDGRREEFLPEIRLRPLVGGLLRDKIEPLTGGSGARMDRLRACGRGERNAARRKFSMQRVKQLEQWRRQIGHLLPLLKSILGSARS